MHGALDLVQLSFEYLPGWRFHSLLGNLCQCSTTLAVKKSVYLGILLGKFSKPRLIGSVKTATTFQQAGAVRLR